MADDLTGNPAPSLPCGSGAAGPPIAIQRAGRIGEAARLLRMAAGLERGMPWADRRPALPEPDRPERD